MKFIIVTAVIILAVLALAVLAAVFIIRSKRAKQRGEITERKIDIEPSAVSKSANELIDDPVGKPSAVESSGGTEYLFSGQTEVLDDHSYLVSMKEITSSGERDISIVVGDEVTVGRLDTNGICVNDPTVSRLQCVFTAGADSVCVRNSSNSNATRLNGNPISGTVPVGAGDIIAFGGVRFNIQDIKST